MNEPVISVIIPTYKTGDYIFCLLEKLDRQTLGKEKFEVIIVLNGEREPYYTKMATHHLLKAPLSNIRLLYSQQAGVSRARNLGLDEAKGSYITFIDDDDDVSPGYLEHLLALADGHSIVATNVIMLEETTGRQMNYYLTDAYKRLAAASQPTLFQARSFLSSVWCKLIPRQAIGTTRFDHSLALGEDALFMFAISHRIAQIRLAPAEAVYYLLYRKDSVSHRHYTYWHRTKEALAVCYRYITTFLKAPTKYDVALWLSRIAATLLKLTQRGYEVTPTYAGQK